MEQKETLNMTISSVMRRNKEKVVYVRFERMGESGIEYAEAIVPKCSFDKIYGFSEEEIAQLKFYLREHVLEIFDEAQKINEQEFFLKPKFK